MGKARKRPYKLGVVIPDLQVPYHDPKSLKAVEEYMADEFWDEYVNLGDFIDFDLISSFNESKPRLTQGKTLASVLGDAMSVLDSQVKAARKKNPKCKMTILEGNHDYRLEAYLDKHPELEDLLDLPSLLRLKENKIKWVRSHSKGELYKIGKAYFHHGLFASKYHAARMVDYYGCNIFYGHTHDVQEYSKVLHGKDKTIKGKSLGCLCSYDQDYLRGRPTNWQQAITVFYFFPNGFFQEVTVPIYNHRFIGPTNGKIYDGGK